MLLLLLLHTACSRDPLGTLLLLLFFTMLLLLLTLRLKLLRLCVSLTLSLGRSFVLLVSRVLSPLRICAPALSALLLSTSFEAPAVSALPIASGLLSGSCLLRLLLLLFSDHLPGTLFMSSALLDHPRDFAVYEILSVLQPANKLENILFAVVVAL